MSLKGKREKIEKKIVIIGFALLLGLPFVMQRSVLPFWHFGMFAAPKAVQAKRKSYYIKKGRKIILPTEFQMSESFFQANARKYAYTSKGKQFFLREIVHIYQKQHPNNRGAEEWSFFQGDSCIYTQEY